MGNLLKQIEGSVFYKFPSYMVMTQNTNKSLKNKEQSCTLMQALTFKATQLATNWLCCQKHRNTGANTSAFCTVLRV